MPSGWPALDAGGRGNLEKRLRYSPRFGLSYSVDFPLTSCIKQLTARMLDLLVAASLTTPEQGGAPHQMGPGPMTIPKLSSLVVCPFSGTPL